MTESRVWECEADRPSCGTFALRTVEQEVRVTGWRMHGIAGSERRGSKAVMRGSGKWYGAGGAFEETVLQLRSCWRE